MSVMRRFLICVLCLLYKSICYAGPADSTFVRTVKLPGGEVVSARIVGDEFYSYLQDINSDRRFKKTESSDEYVLIDEATFNSQRKLANESRKEANKRRSAFGYSGHCYGERNILTVLVNFRDKAIKAENASSFDKILNKERLSEGRYKGSVRDYFVDQSLGGFCPTFDIVGPITLNNTSYYYGANIDGTTDKNHRDIAAEIFNQLKDMRDFTSYSWNTDDDEVVIPICVIFAGLAEETGGTVDDIWCKESMTTFGDTTLLCALTSELRMVDKEIVTNSIGTICHEMSHCFGLPDTYDGNSVFYGAQKWDLMSNGVHNDNGFTPSGYTSLEKMLMGWQAPVELKNDTTISNMKALSAGGEFYRITNDAFPTEFYLIENRQKTNVWDCSLPSTGVLIWHVDYHKYLFDQNIVNTSVNNTHELFSLFQADNNGDVKSVAGDSYPYQSNNSLTNTSIPCATLWHVNVDGSYLMNKPITNIHCNGDGTAGFYFANNNGDVPFPQQSKKNECKTAGTLSHYFFDNSIDTLILSGVLNQEDIRFINNGLTSLQKLDMQDCIVLNSKTGIYGELPNQAFYKNKSLVEIELPQLKNIGEWTFARCPNLTKVIIQDGPQIIPYCLFYQSDRLTEVKLPSTVTEIGDYAFSGCSNLNSIIIPDSVQIIQEYAFYGCFLMDSIKIPNFVHTIKKYAFRGDSNLTYMELPEMIEVLDTAVFRECDLREIVIPESVKKLNYAVFWGNTNIETVICKCMTPPECEDYSFSDNCYTKSTLYVPSEALDSYKNANTWKRFKNISTLDTYDSISRVTPGLNYRQFWIVDKTIHISAADINKIDIYDINGRRIDINSLDTKTISLPYPGIYIVEIDGTKTKIIIR